MRNEILPELANNQIFICGNGCGECKALEDRSVHADTHNEKGNLVGDKSHRVYVSDCCKAEVNIWDKLKEEDVDWPVGLAIVKSAK